MSAVNYQNWRSVYFQLRGALYPSDAGNQGLGPDIPPPAIDGWGVNSLLSNLLDWGTRWEAQGSPTYTTNVLTIPNSVTAGAVLQAVVDQATLALANGPPFGPGPLPAGLVTGWPYGKVWKT